MNIIERNADIDLFKEGYKLFLENCPDSGCCLLYFKRKAELKEINLKKENAIFPEFPKNLMKHNCLELSPYKLKEKLPLH